VVFCLEILLLLSFKLHFLPRPFYLALLLLCALTFVVAMLFAAFELAFWLARRFLPARFVPSRFRTGLFVFACSLCVLALSVFNAFNTKVVPVSVNLGVEKPLQIAVLSDIHVGGFVGEEFTKRIAEKLKTLGELDAIFLVGDLSDASVSLMSERLKPIVSTKTKFGTFAVLGNHEYYMGGLNRRIEALKTAGVRVLENENSRFGGVVVAGVYDLAGFRFNTHKPDFSKALVGVGEGENLNKAGEQNVQKLNLSSDKITQNANLTGDKTMQKTPVIVLSHQPKSVKLLTPNEAKKVSLFVSGHTHKGQVFPFNVIANFINDGLLYGLCEWRGVKMLISSGVGFWGPPFRLGSQSEIILLQIR